MECMYCGKVSNYAPMFIVKRQKYKGTKRIQIGYCCDDCESKGKPTEIKDWIKDTHPVSNMLENGRGGDDLLADYSTGRHQAVAG